MARYAQLAEIQAVEQIDFAAIRLPDGRLYWSKLGHFDALGQAMDEVPDLGPFEEGFITTRGRFVSRAEAYEIAVAAGTVKPSEPTFRRAKNGVKELSSEDAMLDSMPGARTRRMLERVCRG